MANRVTGPVPSRLPDQLHDGELRTQRATIPLLSPQPATDHAPSNLLDSGPLYAGMNVGRITDIRPAAELVKALTP